LRDGVGHGLRIGRVELVLREHVHHSAQVIRVTATVIGGVANGNVAVIGRVANGNVAVIALAVRDVSVGAHVHGVVTAAARTATVGAHVHVHVHGVGVGVGAGVGGHGTVGVRVAAAHIKCIDHISNLFGWLVCLRDCLRLRGSLQRRLRRLRGIMLLLLLYISRLW
jgi:hypothetical protein